MGPGTLGYHIEHSRKFPSAVQKACPASARMASSSSKRSLEDYNWISWGDVLAAADTDRNGG